MHHIDEHTIELYILGSELVKEQIAEIEAHLKECHGCRTVAGQMKAFYKNAENSFQASEDYLKSSTQKSKALVRVNKAVEQYYEPFSPPERYRPNTPLAKIYYFVRRHPVVTITSSFAMFAVIGWILNDFIKSDSKGNFITDKKPDSYLYNSDQNRLEINNKQGQTLWYLNTWDALGDNLNEGTHNILLTQLVDLNGDDNNEIVTTVSIRNEDYSRHGSLRIFNNEGNLLQKIEVNQDIIYNGKQYQREMYANGLITYASENSKQKEILFFANNGRSPCKIVRANYEGKILGNYYHYGFLSIANISTSTKEFLLFGFDDNVDERELSSSCILLLDPTKIIGDSKSSQAPGFSYKTTDAEEIYMQIPPTKINEFYKINPSIKRILPATFDGRDALSVIVEGVIDEDNGFAYEYIISSDLHVLEVKYIRPIGKFAQQIDNEKELEDVDTKTYLDSLKKEVQYWDGKVWHKEWARVKQQP